MISGQKVFIEQTAGVKVATMCLKIAENCKYLYLQCHNSNTINLSTYFCVCDRSGHRNQQLQ